MQSTQINQPTFYGLSHMLQYISILREVDCSYGRSPFLLKAHNWKKKKKTPHHHQTNKQKTLHKERSDFCSPMITLKISKENFATVCTQLKCHFVFLAQVSRDDKRSLPYSSHIPPLS